MFALLLQIIPGFNLIIRVYLFGVYRQHNPDAVNIKLRRGDRGFTRFDRGH
jgi:hypothetical protein